MTSAENKAVFLSYASQDAEAARRICETLRASGVEVWFDADGGLEHGDEWDAKIRRQIKECVLFIAVISANTQARHEGYFRIEWDLAAERARGIASGVPFILPVVVDDTREPDALVPDRFRAVQWTKLRGGEVPPDVQQRFLKLWSHRTGVLKHEAARSELELGRPRPSERYKGVVSPTQASTRRGRLAALGAAAIMVVALAIWQPWKTARPSAAPIAVSPEVAELLSRTWKLIDNPDVGRADLEAAEELCKRAATLDPTSPSVLATWSHVDAWFIMLSFDDGAPRREAARARVLRAVQMAPRAFETRLALANFQVRDANYQAPANAVEIETTLRALLREREGNPHALRALGLLQRFTGKVAESRRTFEELARNPEFAAIAWCEIAYMHAQAGDFRAAEEAVDASLARQQIFWSLKLKISLLLEWHGDSERANALVARLPSESLREDHGFLTALSVHTARRDGQAILRLLENTPREWVPGPMQGPKAAFAALAYNFLGREQAAALQRNAALRLVDQRLAETPNSLNLLSWKAWLTAFDGNVEESGRLFRLLGELRNRPDFDLVMAHVVLKQFDVAIDVLEQLEKEPKVVLTAATLRNAWYLDPLRRQPRFQALQARLDSNPRSSPTGKTASAGPAVITEKSLAVLPFANQSDDKANESFSDGVSEELGVVLGKVPGLRMAGWNSALSFKGKNVPEAEIAQKLGVTHIVSGSVRRDGTQVRITARLVNAADGFELWSDSFKREAKDIFAVQDEIAGLIAENLKLRLGVDPRRSRAVNPEAHRLVLEGRHFWNQRNDDGFARAEAAFLKAIDLDPTFPEAHTGLAGVYVVRGTYQTMENSAREIVEDFRRARLAATKAVALGPDLAEAHAVLGYTLFNQGERTAAGHEFAKALTLNPNSAATFTWSGVAASVSGRLDTALASYAKAATIDPLWFINLHMYAEALLYGARYEEALRIAEHAAALRSDTFIPNLGLRARILYALGRTTEAVAVARTVRTQLRLDTRWTADAQAIYVLRQCGEVKEAADFAVEALRQLEAKSPTRAHIFAALGNLDEALPTIGGTSMTMRRYLLWDPIWAPWRDDPRFHAALAQLGCAEDYKIARETLARLKKEPEAKK